MFITPKHTPFIPYNPLSIDGRSVQLVDSAEHVGVIRSNFGKMPKILQRIKAFKQALGGIVSCGLAKSQRSNPTASLRILTSYCTPVLMSGLASLNLTNKEISTIDLQMKITLQNVLKLPKTSPSALVHFTAGSLPGPKTPVLALD